MSLVKIYYNVAKLIIGFALLCSCEGDFSDSQPINAVNYDESIAIIPDIQFYTNTEDYYHYIKSITDYCNSSRHKISVCLQTGDLTNNNEEWQWTNANQKFISQMPKDIPLIYCLGNHDYGDLGSSNKRESNIPLSMLLVGDVSMPNSKYDNFLKFVNIGATKYAVLVLEFAPRNNVLEWSNEIIKKYSDIPFIILTHAFLNKQGVLFDYRNADCDNSDSQKVYSMGGDYVNDSKEIFDKIIYNNVNVKMVICGHSLHKDYIAVEYVDNEAGKHIPCIMVNYQDYADGGKGMIGILAKKGNTCYLYSYSTVSSTYTGYYTSFLLD